MKRTTALREIRESSLEELQGRLARLEGELFRFRLRRATNQLENTMQIRATRREIAQVMTVLGQRAQGPKVPQSDQGMTE
jgi:large subunit ribosomal protein L29